ncbi:hypothetical protein [Kribbella sp. CA-293567]|uniref:hypothetical protein n=1 Tax=Kribbella sp. CA-293567 TaxID=3002436 RepID=UPI0022DE2577|nr:hypothetical protein [Kribbella sp. CA-293567]WBQ02974.1 hypothetical protein OX958_23690 [Kribbella sp. CA-293567]
MPFGTPTSLLAQATYGAVFTHTNGIQIRITREDPAAILGDPVDFDEAIQSAVDVMNASPDWTFEGGGKTYPTNATLTPTP